MTEIVRWQDVLDILIVAFIIYRVLLLIRGTRALQLVVGLIIVFFAFYLSKKLELFTLGWILNNFVSSILLVIVVIFQNEIRHVLFVLGRSPFFRKITYVEETLFFDELVNACTIMGKKRTGALIVLEREMGLGEFVEGGIVIDADVNTELLVSLFQTTSPLHDGAVVIKEGRIRAASCVLPLSVRDDMDKDFGTRHRAAIGITEVADAVSVVVSEESGQISYCRGGELVRNANPEALKRALKELLQGKKVDLAPSGAGGGAGRQTRRA
ncbi:MAG: diadenylate cyclase CdaA [Syntrophorhabdales bacterium]